MFCLLYKFFFFTAEIKHIPHKLPTVQLVTQMFKDLTLYVLKVCGHILLCIIHYTYIRYFVSVTC